MASDLTRRQMLLMSALAAAAFVPGGDLLAAGTSVIDVGELSKYAEDAIYSDFRAAGLFIIRRGGRIVAQSSICTHKRSKLTPKSDGFFCKTHNSAFSLDGEVVRPPAKENLPRHRIWIEGNHLMVDLNKSYKTAQFDSAGAFVQVPASKA